MFMCCSLAEKVASLVGPGSDLVWPLFLRAGPPISGPDPRTFRAGPGWPSGHGPLALPVDSLAAYEALAAFVIGALHFAEKFVLVGDHNQLPPLVSPFFRCCFSK